MRFGRLATGEEPGKLTKFFGRILFGVGIGAAPPIEENSVYRMGPCCERPDQRGSDVAVVFPAREPEAAKQRANQRLLKPIAPAIEHLRQDGWLSQQREAAGELREIPMDRLGLPAKSIQPVMVEIGRSEIRLPMGRESPRPVVEALAGDVDIVAV